MPLNQKRKFYIIGHNPNTVEEARQFLERGANALEPDIVFDQQFFVSHGDIFAGSVPLNEYLTGLKDLLVEFNNFNLALIAFDIKTPTFDINMFLRQVKDNFSDVVCEGVAILVTVGSIDDVGFLNNYDQSFIDVGIGVDECDNPVDVENAFLTNLPAQKHIAYADGTHFLVRGRDSHIYDHIQQAENLRFSGSNKSFKLIYPWVIRPKYLMRDFLNITIDGMITDIDDIGDLIEVLGESSYRDKYEIALKGYNPYTILEPPGYNLTIITKDIHLAGTNSLVQFSLTGTTGVVSGLIDGRVGNNLEKGTTCQLIIEGDVGEIFNLKIQVVEEHGFYPEWFPQEITVGSNRSSRILRFDYGGFDSRGEPIDVGVRIDHPLITNPF